jgi:hypothetical protein
MVDKHFLAIIQIGDAFEKTTQVCLVASIPQGCERVEEKREGRNEKRKEREKEGKRVRSKY